jgi:hypothetical protein
MPRSALLVCGLFLASSLVACSDDAESSGSPAGNTGTPPPSLSTDRIDAAAIASCPAAKTVLTTPEWITCLAGRRVAGKEPFGDVPCELRIGQGGAFEYVRNGAMTLSVPPRASWGASAFGTYQNDTDAFIAALSPDLPVAAGNARLEKLRVFFVGRGVEDNIEIDYLDAALARATYACRVEVL